MDCIHACFLILKEIKLRYFCRLLPLIPGPMLTVPSGGVIPQWGLGVGGYMEEQDSKRQGGVMSGLEQLRFLVCPCKSNLNSTLLGSPLSVLF